MSFEGQPYFSDDLLMLVKVVGRVRCPTQPRLHHLISTRLRGLPRCRGSFLALARTGTKPLSLCHV